MSASERYSAVPSFWAATANPHPDLPALSGDIDTDVAIVGGGFTGLTTAHYLQRSGIECVVLEANDAGWGASGRNGGMAVLRYKSGWTSLADQLGLDTAQHMFRVLHDAIDSLESTIAHYGIDCGFSRCGHLTAAHGPKPLAALAADVRWLEREMGYEGASVLSGDATRRAIGTDEYVGAYLERRSGGIHPLNYARGLAAGVAANTRVFVSTPVTGYRREAPGFVLDTPSGRVRAKRIVVATNAYTGLFPLPNDLARRIVPVPSNLIATEPLSSSVAQSLLAAGHVVTDSRRVNLYFRMSPDRRMVFGSRGHLSGSNEPWAFEGIEAAMHRVFPALRESRIDYRWNGKVGFSLDFFPHFGQAEPGLYYGIGYSGRGVVLTHMAGKVLAAMLRGDAVDAGPLTRKPFRPIPLHSLHPLGIRLYTAYYRLLDAREEAR
ncbi:MAG: FAD-dependent oxidoreductase [Burkholderiales bacterium]|nr:FAD-dependent oxidoreductase [Burkholderiales bacterium]